MISIKDIKTRIFSIKNEEDFFQICMDTFQYQAEKNETFSFYLRQLGRDPKNIAKIGDIPFLPISFFKTHHVITGSILPELYFESSGTGQMSRSKHFISDPSLYSMSLLEGFKRVYGDPKQYVFLALLPTYLENPHSSLIYMVDELMKSSGQELNGYFKDDLHALKDRIDQCKKEGKRFFLFGVTYALLQFAEINKDGLGEHAIVLETGGMKGKGKELIREELHEILKEKLKVNQIQSEYGMTELLSQAYCSNGNTFSSPPWMRIYIRDIYDPFSYLSEGRTGAINVIDLANIHSCSFIATDDLGKLSGQNSFEVLGRLDNSDIRGCNLLV